MKVFHCRFRVLSSNIGRTFYAEGVKLVDDATGQVVVMEGGRHGGSDRVPALLFDSVECVDYGGIAAVAAAAVAAAVAALSFDERVKQIEDKVLRILADLTPTEQLKLYMQLYAKGFRIASSHTVFAEQVRKELKGGA